MSIRHWKQRSTCSRFSFSLKISFIPRLGQNKKDLMVDLRYGVRGQL
ncbi:hypothetical protein V6Z12_A11G236100 [Gossypium hirsutum]